MQESKNTHTKVGIAPASPDNIRQMLKSVRIPVITIHIWALRNFLPIGTLGSGSMIDQKNISRLRWALIALRILSGEVAVTSVVISNFSKETHALFSKTTKANLSLIRFSTAMEMFANSMTNARKSGKKSSQMLAITKSCKPRTGREPLTKVVKCVPGQKPLATSTRA